MRSEWYLELVVERIEEILRSKKSPPLSSYPQGSFIAGGAIGNIILSKHFGLDLPINDIDIFQDESIADRDSNDSSLPIADDMYMDCYSADTPMPFSIKETSRQGIVNFILTRKVFRSDEASYAKMVLSSFDMNCVEVGILRQEDGSWALQSSSAFEQLLISREVKITRLTYPFRTLVRWYKKQAELKGLFFSKSDDLKIFQVLAFGQAQFARATTLEKYFDYVAKSCRGWISLKMVKDDLYEIIPNREHPLLQPMNQKERRAFGKVPGLIFDAANIKFSAKKAIRAKYFELAGYPNLLRVAVNNNLELHLNFQVSRTHLKNAELIANRFPNITKSFLLNSKDSFKNMVEFLSEIMAFLNRQKLEFSRNELNSFYGMIETNMNSLREGQTSLDELLKQFCDQRAIESALLNETLPVPVELLGVTIVELRSAFALRLEGDEMDHCVGGYSGELKSGACRIYSMISESGRSTLQVNLASGLEKAFIVQNRARANSRAPASHQKAAVDLIKLFRKSDDEQMEFSESSTLGLAI